MLIHTRGLQRKKQPQSPVSGIDWSNPLTKEFVDVYLPLSNAHPTLIRKYTGSTTTGVGILGKTIASGSGVLLASDGDELFPSTTDATIFVIRRSTDTVARASNLFGYDGGGADRVLCHAPYSDGVMYFDFGTADGTNRLAVGFTKSTDVDYLVFVAGGGKGREIWRNGVKIAGDTTKNGSRAATTMTFSVGGSDLEEIYLFGTAKRAWSDPEIESWFDKPWQIFERSTRRVFIGSSGTPVSNSAIANIEALQAVAKQCQYSIESLGRAAQTYTVLIESLARVAQSAVVNIESLSRVDKQAAQNIEALAAINKAGVPNIESLATVNKSGSANIESLLSTSQARSQNVESLGGVFSPRVINIEALGGIEVAKAAIISIEALGFINKQSVLGIEALSRLAVSASITFESLLTTTKQGAANIEALAAVVVLRVQNIEAKQSVTKLSVFSFETLAGISKLFDVPIEALQGAVINIITNTVDKTVTFTLTLSKGAKFTTTLPKTIKF